MIINKYLRDGGKIFDETFTYPESVANVKDDVMTLISSLYRSRELQLRYDIYDSMGYDNISDMVVSDVYALIVKKAYEYDKLYNTLSLEYDPIANVDGTETTTDTLGATHTETSSGAHTDSTSFGADSKTQTAKISAENVSSFANADEVTDSRLAHTDSTSYGAHVVETDGDAVENVHVIERHGNIGVTSTQELIRQERDVAKFSFVGTVARDIINMICEGVF